MSKLVDTQLVLLSNAAQREDRLVVLPDHLTGAAATKAIKPLLRNRFVEEMPASNGHAVYRRDGDGNPIALRVTDRGLSVIGIEPEGMEAVPTDVKPPVEKQKAAAGKTSGKPASKQKARSKPAPASHKKVIPAAPVPSKGRPKSPPAQKTGAKQALLISMLQRKQGADINAIVEATEWLPHTGRAMISGLRKVGYRIDVRRNEDGKAVYRIIGMPKRSSPRKTA
ncbi:MAG: DUF3489 domain-containing protein [Bradyrhizobiaceae bacterium]|nr:DUF3489 domain-containing protein [Bradyrhizobiaceae bacterium]